MKRRLFKLLNFVAFSLLFFALYLNFVHRDINTIREPEKKKTENIVRGNILIDKPEQYLNKSENITKQKIENKKNTNQSKPTFN